MIFIHNVSHIPMKSILKYCICIGDSWQVMNTPQQVEGTLKVLGVTSNLLRYNKIMYFLVINKTRAIVCTTSEKDPINVRNSQRSNSLSLPDKKI